MEMKSEVGVCVVKTRWGVGERVIRSRGRESEDRNGSGGMRHATESMRQSRCDRVDATESMEWRSRHRVSAVTRT